MMETHAAQPPHDAVLEPDRKRTAAEVVDRVHEHFGCEHGERLTQKVA